MMDHDLMEHICPKSAIISQHNESGTLQDVSLLIATDNMVVRMVIH